jgi:hypothetical protein
MRAGEDATTTIDRADLNVVCPSGVCEASSLYSGSRAPAFSRYETYVRIVVDDLRPPDRCRSTDHRCAAAWIEPDES